MTYARCMRSSNSNANLIIVFFPDFVLGTLAIEIDVPTIERSRTAPIMLRFRIGATETKIYEAC